MKQKCYYLLLFLCLNAFGCLFAAKCDTIKKTFTGSLFEKDYFIPHYVSVQIPKNTVKIIVEQQVQSLDGHKGGIDMGIFDERGIDFGNVGFRGWSGGARNRFEISEDFATPGYLPGKVNEGEWHIVQMLVKKIPEIQWKLKVSFIIGKNKFNPFKPIYAKKKINEQEGWYRIDTHVHSVHSDGKNTLQEIVELAQKAGLDGFISTEHNTNSALQQWGIIQPDSLLIINGVEVTYIDGHWNIFGLDPEAWVDFRFRCQEKERYLQLIEKAQELGSFMVANHPYSIEYKYDKSLMDGIEVWNGTWDQTDEKAVQTWHNMLVAGVYKIAIGGSDYHNRKNQFGLPHMVIHARGLSEPEIIKGIAAGTSYLVKDASVSLDMEAIALGREGKYARIGEYLWVDSLFQVSFSSSVSGMLYLYNQKGLCYCGFMNRQEIIQFVPDKQSDWIRAELRDSVGNMIALTNPIFISR